MQHLREMFFCCGVHGSSFYGFFEASESLISSAIA